MTALSALRLALYAMLAIFSVALMGLTAARIQHTKTHLGSYYDPIVAELLSVSILSFIWSIPVMTCIGARVESGFISSYLVEILGLFALWVMYLVGAAIFAADFHNVNFCWRLSSQCRLMTSIHAFAWTNFILLFFLLLATFGDLLFGRSGFTAPLHGGSGSAAAGYGAGRRGHETHNAPGGGGQQAGGQPAGGQQGGPETRSVEGAPVSQGQGSAA